MKAKIAIKEPVKFVTIDCGENKFLQEVVDEINQDPEIRTLWRITSVMAIRRMNMTDHGILHFNIVANNALAIARLLLKRNFSLSITKDYGLLAEDAELVVVLASLLHDLGMSVHRINHEEFSVVLAQRLLERLLAKLPVEKRTIIISEILHAIFSHRSEGHPLTLEAGIVRVADALDMSGGRSRIPYDNKKMDIHSVSAMAIDDVEIKPGHNFPVQIEITMNHTAGLFQVDQFLQKKIVESQIDRYLQVLIFINKDGKKQLFKDFYRR
ncbi:HD domain-containing protein [Patescibacteria group bacterium]|nr:HD domain-containing protein [Patescibacteria group bacterium]